MKRLEAAKVQTFSPQTLEVFFFAFQRENWTNRKFLDRAQAVLKMQQVRREITIDDFFHAPPASDHEVLEDAKWLAEQLRLRRLAAMRELKIDGAAITREGWRTVEEEGRLVFARELESVQEKLRERCRAARKGLRTMTDERLRDLYATAVLAKIIRPIDEVIEKNDSLLRGWLRSFLPMRSNYDADFRASIEAYLMTNPYQLLELMEKRMTP